MEGRSLKKQKIRAYMGAPLVTGFDGLKVEAMKFIVSRYHKGKAWLNKLIEIPPQLILQIIGLSFFWGTNSKDIESNCLSRMVHGLEG